MAAVIQRPLRGSRISTFYPVKNLPSLASLDSAFQLQEYISLLIRLDVHDVDAIISLPGSSTKGGNLEEQGDGTKARHKESEKGKNEVTVDEACWVYEQLRRLAQDLSHPLITTLQQECTRASCPEMKAGEWLYLCVAHGNDGAMEQCCAIDYILHTVDSATALLNSPRTFPSRLQIPQTSHRHFSSLARRLGRIFAHAYFHHRDAFEQAEAESSLYARFLALTAKFDLVPAEFLVIPSSQFSGDYSRDRDEYETRQHYPPQLRPENHQRLSAVITERQEHQDSLNEDDGPNQRSPSTNGGIGESPTSASRSRFGRNRTGTMVFSEGEASAISDELAARARAGELEPDFEAEGPKALQPSAQEEEDSEVDAGTHVEISLDPEEEIRSVFNEDITAVPEESSLALEKIEEVLPLPVEVPLPDEEEALEEENLEVEELELQLEPVPAEEATVEEPASESTPIVVASAEPETETFAEEEEEESLAEVLDTIPPPTTTEEALQPELVEPTAPTTEVSPSIVEEITPGLPMVTDASILVDTKEPGPTVGESAATVTEQAEVATTLVGGDVVSVASTTDIIPVGEETPKEETSKGDVAPQ